MTVGRFQVMATLQAARAFTLGLPKESSLSWGLTKAIFYAAAKRGFKGVGGPAGGAAGRAAPSRTSSKDKYFLGDDMAFTEDRGGKPYFKIGGKVQTSQDFERQIERRFAGAFQSAWKEALDYVGGFQRETLLSASDFYSVVYRPLRDSLAEKWSAAAETEKPGITRTTPRGTRRLSTS